MSTPQCLFSGICLDLYIYVDTRCVCLPWFLEARDDLPRTQLVIVAFLEARNDLHKTKMLLVTKIIQSVVYLLHVSVTFSLSYFGKFFVCCSSFCTLNN